MGEIEEPVDHFHPLIKSQPLLNNIFGPLINRDDPHADNQENPIFPLHLYPNIQSRSGPINLCNLKSRNTLAL
jgi:hypothetical protein